MRKTQDNFSIAVQSSRCFDAPPTSSENSRIKSTALLSIMLALGTFAGTSLPAYAMSYDQAVKKGTVKLNEITPLAAYLNKSGSSELKKLQITNIKKINKGLTGEATILKKKFSVLFYAGKTPEKSLMAFTPNTFIKFKDAFKSVPGMSVLDNRGITKQTLVLAAADLSVRRQDLPAQVAAFFTDYYPDRKDYTLKIGKGLSFVETINLQKSGVLNDAVKMLGGKSTTIQMQTVSDGRVMNSFVKKSAKLAEPKLKITGLLPLFKPKIGGLISIPANVQFALFGSLDKKGLEVGYKGTTDVKIGKQKVNMVIASSYAQPIIGAPIIKATATTFEGVPWTKAFGLKWLTIEDYTMDFKVAATGTVTAGFGGKTTIGEKKMDMYAAAKIGTESAGFPIPGKVRLEITDGDKKVGSLSLKDMASIYNEIQKEAGAGAKVPLSVIPDLAITGLKKGEGPKIDMTIATSSSASFEIQGKLRVLGQELATIEKSFIKPTEGIYIQAKSKGIDIGPLKMPTADILVDIRYDPETKKVPTPQIVFKGTGTEIFGSKSSMDMTIALNKLELAAQQHFGKLLQFNFLATSGEALKKFADLKKADLRLDTSLASDPAKWINTSGKEAVKDAAAEMKKSFTVATKALDSAKDEVRKLDNEISKQRKIVEGEHEDVDAAFNAARGEVAKLNKTIKGIERRIDSKKKNIKSCSQTINIGIGRVPNYPARGICEAENMVPRAEIAWAETEKLAVIVAKGVAQETLHLTQQGMAAIPVDADPRVAGIIAGRGIALASLDVAKLSVAGVEELTKIIDKEVVKVNIPTVFALEKSSIQGSMRKAIAGKPVVLDMNFKLLDKHFGQSFGFSMTDMAFNAEQMEVIVLKVFVDGIVAAGKKAKIIPHALLGKVEEVYLRKQAQVQKVLEDAMSDNKVTSLASGDRMGKNIEQSNLDREKTLKAERQVVYNKMKQAQEKIDGANNKAMKKAANKYSKSILHRNVVLKVKSTGKCLDLRGDGNYSQYSCHKKDNQRWNFIANGMIKSKSTNRRTCMHITTEGKVIKHRCMRDKNKKPKSWQTFTYDIKTKAIKTTFRPTGYTNKSREICLEAERNGSKKNVYLYYCNGQPQQQWEMSQ